MRFNVNDIIKYKNLSGVTAYYLITDYFPGDGFTIYDIQKGKELDRTFDLLDREDYWFQKVEENNVIDQRNDSQY